MKIGTVSKVLSFICFVVAFSMIPSFFIAVYDGTHDAVAFAGSITIGVFTGVLLTLHSRKKVFSMGIREGVGVTGFSWIIASALGALPYYFSGSVPGYSDAFFETMSGFTTTGATIFTEIEALPRGILLWRSLTHLMGGMGIIVLSLAVLPFLGVSGMEMYKAEVPGVTAEKITPRLHQTAMRLWGIYISFTIIETLLLTIGGMSFFDAFNHSCSTIATGGFSTKNNSIAYFTSPYIQWVIIIFMFASGVNFSLYFMLMQNRIRDFFKDEELKLYAGIVIFSALAMSIALYFSGSFRGIEDTLRRTLFHVVSVMTTTGFIVEDYNLWPEFTKFLFVTLMFIGASGGSTGGGCKVSRFLILGRQLKAEVWRLLHPRAVITARMNGQPIPRGTIDSSTAFFVLYMSILVAGTAITSAFGIDILTAFTGVMTCLSNVGPGLNALGPVENFAWLPDFVKWLFSLCMLAGRLELFAVLLLFMPGTYRK
ncbi:MAG: TrkH family potassium uptake protein [Synergistales bacterium]|nr:TrkH family potassium uptake protein [Synergistales bacterium]MDY6401531.1 TrkH family potassium uptake protein [Synergistales bacterium]MDY6405069.1 TrkH family potassium uptake protein [Synergistales bacterium]MDY6411125.1 TrkH family potassium uptake protein [Synergistales bacterium]MDY6413928.1 TrkH family potassium uptake protein [Synergistales bacterium]